MLSAKKREVIEYIDEHASLFTDVSDRIWEFAELSLKEFQSAKLYIDLLKEHGFAVQENLGGMETAFYGSCGHGRPVIGLLAEFDALSGLNQMKGRTDPISEHPGDPGHGCGHNMLGAGSLAAAFALKAYLEKTGAEGTVIFFGCPGEEGGAGKAFLAKQDVWKNLDCALTWHPGDINEVVSGTNNSCIQVLYEFEGIAAHAAGDPENGRSALDAVELMNIGVQYLREHMKSDCRVHYAIIDGGGVSPNVVQAHASVLYMVRAVKSADSKKLLERVDRIADGAARMTDTTVHRKFIDATAEIVPNFTLEELLLENFREIGTPSYTKEEWTYAAAVKKHCPDTSTPGIAARYSEEAERTLRALSQSGTRALNDFLSPLVHTNGFVAGSSDVGDVSWQTPTAQFHVTAFVAGAPGHSWQNVSCGATSIAHKALLTAGKILGCSVIDLLDNPALLEKARLEFAEKTEGGYLCLIEDGAKPVAL